MLDKLGTSYYEAGYSAFEMGRDILDNEYSPDSHAWREWRNGWNAALYDSRVTE